MCRNLHGGTDFAVTILGVLREELPQIKVPVVIQVVAIARPSPRTLEIKPAGQVPQGLQRKAVVLMTGTVGDVINLRKTGEWPGLVNEGPFVGHGCVVVVRISAF